MNVYETCFSRYTKIGERPCRSYQDLIDYVNLEIVDSSKKKDKNAVIVLGYSGNGKSTWIESFRRANPDYEVISMDSVARSLGEYPKKSEVVRIFGEKLEKAHDEEKNIIVDGNFLNLLTRSALLDTLKTYDYQVNLVDITDNVLRVLPQRILDVTASRLNYPITKENIDRVLESEEFKKARKEVIDFYNDEKRRSYFDEQISYGVVGLGADHLYKGNTPFEIIKTIDRVKKL